MIIYILFLGGTALLVKGAALLVKGASGLAYRSGIPELVLGLTLVALGTSLPELSISIIASIKGNADLAIGNIIGSNITNILLVLGLTAIVSPLTIKRQTTWTEIPFSLFAAVLFAALTNDGFIRGAPENILTRLDGFVFLLLTFAFFLYIYTAARRNRQKLPVITEIPLKATTGRLAVMAFAGLIMLALGGKLIIENATAIAAVWGVSQAFIGLIIVAVGTSLPELATSIIAVYKNKTDIAVGNIIGSNILNIFLILGVSASLNPIRYNPLMNFDAGVMIFSSVLIFASMFIGKKHNLSRWFGIMFVLFYLAYLAYSVYRG